GRAGVALCLEVEGFAYGREQAGEAARDLFAARGILHLDAAALAADKPGLAQRLEVLGEGRFGDRLFADVEEVRAVHGTLRAGDIGVDRRAHRIRERIENAFDRDVFD